MVNVIIMYVVMLNVMAPTLLLTCQSNKLYSGINENVTDKNLTFPLVYPMRVVMKLGMLTNSMFIYNTTIVMMTLFVMSILITLNKGDNTFKDITYNGITFS
jgi:hypothetical protein